MEHVVEHAVERAPPRVRKLAEPSEAVPEPRLPHARYTQGRSTWISAPEHPRLTHVEPTSGAPRVDPLVSHLRCTKSRPPAVNCVHLKNRHAIG